MKLWYNSVALHDLGRIIILNQSSAGEPEEAPQRWKRALRVRINFHEATFADNYDLIGQARTALKTQSATLKWQDRETDTIFLEQTATLADHDLPEDPNQWGRYFQAMTLTFTFYDETLTTNCLSATYKRTGEGTPTLTLGRVLKLKSNATIQRYSPMRSHRQLDAGRIEVSGYFKGNPLATLTDRKAALLAEYDQWMSEIKAGKDGAFAFGSISETVRVEEFSPELDQPNNQINWSLVMSYTRFPNEASYAQAEFQVSTREDTETGNVTVSLSGSVGAQTKAAALVKLAAIRTAYAGASYTALRKEVTDENVAADSDGEAFIKLTFADEYQKIASNLLDWSLKISDAGEVRSGLLLTTYSGSVRAKASTYSTAYGIAADQARTLGDDKYQFKLNARLESEDHQRLATGDIVVRVDFNFDYQRKGARLYLEVSSSLAQPTFGNDEERISGYIIGQDQTAMDAAYTAILAPYNDRLIRDRNKTTNRQEIAKYPITQIPSTRRPPDTATVLETEVSGKMVQVMRTEFNFVVHKAKATSATAMKYEFDVQQDFIAREKTTTLTGTIWADAGPAPDDAAEDTNTAEIYLDAFLAGLSLGTHTQSKRSASREKAPTIAGPQSDQFIGMNFSETFTAPLATDGILDCELNEEIECAGNRLVVQPTAAGPDVVQICGTQSGRRTVSGTVTATSEAAAMAWINKQRQLPFYNNEESLVPDPRNLAPPRVRFQTVFIPLTDGIARTGTYEGFGAQVRNAKFTRASFEFMEIMPEYTIF